jgi:cullin 1
LTEWWRCASRDVYDICVHQNGDYAADLYERLRVLLVNHLKKQQKSIAPHRGEDLVKQYCHRFKAFIKATSYIRRIAEYMHRFWIPLQISDGPPDADIRELNTLVLVEWDSLVLKRVELLLPVMFDLIDASRTGDRVDWDALSGVIRSFSTVGQGLDPDQPIDLYTECFEGEFLKRAHDFYKAASAKFLSQNSVPDYMRKVDVWLREEDERADKHLQEATKPKLQEQCTKALIDDWKDTYILEFDRLVKADSRADLSTMHRLLSRSKDARSAGDSPNLVRTVARKFEALIADEGKKLIQVKINAVGTEVKSVEQIKRCLPLIKDLSDLHDKYKRLVEGCFDNNHIFVQELDTAFKKFVNTSVGGFNMSELLAYYCDHLMRSTNRGTEEECGCSATWRIRTCSMSRTAAGCRSGC